MAKVKTKKLYVGLCFDEMDKKELIVEETSNVLSDIKWCDYIIEVEYPQMHTVAKITKVKLNAS